MLRTLLVPSLLAVLLLAAGMPSGALSASAAEAAQDGLGVALRGLLAGDDPLKLAGRTLDRPTLARLYELRGYEPIWAGAPERELALIEALAGAAAHGLDPAVFAVPKARPEERELLLTDAFLRYAAALAQGRVSSAAIESDWAIPVPRFDPVAALDRAAGGNPAAVLEALAPSEPGYKGLQAALVRYRAIVASGGWPRVPRVGKLVRGDVSAAVATLRRRLIAEGFLPPTTPAGSSTPRSRRR